MNMISVTDEKKQQFINFHLPTYKEIPAVGLYLDQVSKYINDCLKDIPGCIITNSMIANYVKHKLIANPVKKQYGRDQIAYLIFIVLTKNTLSLEDVNDLFELQNNVSSVEEAYGFFAEVFETNLHQIFSTEQLQSADNTTWRRKLMSNIVLSSVQRIYLGELLKAASSIDFE